MVENRDFISALVDHFRFALEPLRCGLSSAENMAQLAGTLGWQLLPGDIDIVDVQTLFGVQTVFEDVQDLIGEAGAANGAAKALLYSQALTRLQSIVSAIQNLANATSEPMAFPFLTPEFRATFPTALLDYLIIRYLTDYQPTITGPLLLLGVISETFTDVGSTPGRQDYIRREIHWDRLADLRQPERLIDAAYGWEVGPFQFEQFVKQAFRALEILPFMPSAGPASQEFLDTYYDAGNPVRDDIRELRLPLLSGSDSAGEPFYTGLSLLPISADGNLSGAPVGMAMLPLVFGTPPSDPKDALGWQIHGGFELHQGLVIEIRPDGVSFSPSDTGQIDAEVKRDVQSDEPTILVGAADTHRIEYSGYQLGLRVLGPTDDPELVLEIKPKHVALVLQLSDSDAFVQDVAGRSETRFAVDISLAWSSKRGLMLAGNPGLQAAIPIRQRLGMLTINDLVLGVGTTGERLSLEASVSGDLQLGPVGISVDQVGLQFSVGESAGSESLGNFGVADIDFGFQPPRGLRLSMSAGPVVGGGSLYFDEPNHRYVGAMQLAFGGIELNAIGLLTTQMPDGSAGYSLLILISAEFEPMQLGFGFTLNGVGGLMGLHRSANIEALRAGIRQNTLDAILFPDDPMRDAPRIISDLRRVFPPTQGRHIFGPMALIGWGNPQVLTAKVGILVELPDPARLVILGQAKAVLPSEDKQLIRIHVAILGILDFAQGEFSLDATVYDSKLGAYDLAGDLALRSRWKGQSAFALSVGGFHPRFQPPPGFPALRRMTVSLGQGNNPRLNLEGYLAITSNSVQFGARLELYAASGGFSVHGYLGFDALFIFSPFSFEIDVAAGVGVHYKGVDLASVHLEGTLFGPRPWRVRGEATFKIWIFKYSKHFDKRFGPSQPLVLPPKDPTAPLHDAIADPRNWASHLPANADMIVTIRKSDHPTTVRAHPIGTLEMRQKVVPLDHTIERFGGGAPPGDNRFHIDAVVSNDLALSSLPLEDDFAPGQFEALTEDEKLTRRAFERMQSGVRVQSDRTLISAHVVRNLDYETVYVDKARSRRVVRGMGIARSLGLATLAHSAARRSPMANRGPSRFGSRRDTPMVALHQERYVIADADGLVVQAIPGMERTGATQAQANKALDAYIEDHSHHRGSLQVVPAYEAVTI